MVDDEEQGDRQAHQHDAADSALSGQGLHLAKNLETLTNDMADLIQNLGQIAPRLPLDHD